jgi:glycosyltransferase involved in cell wall biosynthesis
MRALLITDWMAGSGGAESYITWVRDGLRAAGDEVRLLTSSAGTAGDGSAEYRAYGTDLLVAQAFLQIVNPFAVAEVRRALREFRPDVAFVNMFEHHLSPVILGQLRGVPTVLSLTDYKSVCPLGTKLLPDGRICSDKAGAVCLRRSCVSLPHWLRDQPRYALIRSGMRRVNRVLTCSRWMQRVLASNGVAAEHLPLPVPEPRHGFRCAPAEEPLFVFCGRLDAEKGLPLLLRAFARVRADLPGARLRIVGRGPQRSMLDDLTAALLLKEAVTFRGWVAPTEVERELEDAWALVAPSLWAEPLGLVAIEAIVRGVPVVASASGGLGETVQDGVSGLLFPNGDEAALAERLDAVARGRAFPDHQLPAALVRRMRETHGVAAHIGSLRRIFAETAGLAGAPQLTATE